MKKENIIITSIIGTILVAASAYFLLKKKPKVNTDSGDASVQYSKTITVSGSRFAIPAYGNAFYSESSVSANKKAVSSIKSKYQKPISNVLNSTKLNEDLLLSFIFIESAGVEKAVSSANAIGLMQITVGTANDIVRRDVASGKLDSYKRNLLVSVIGSSNTEKLIKSNMGDTTQYIKSADLFNPELNIMLGASLINQIIDRLKENNLFTLNRIVILYNRGFYLNKTQYEGTASEVFKKQPAETRNFIIKLLGKNGLLDILID